MTTAASVPVAPEFNEELWRIIFGVGHPLLIEKQQRFRVQGLPPRCKLCFAPFGTGPGEAVGADIPAPSNRNPRYCSMCDVFIRANPGGARVHMSMVFADVRDSTVLAEQLELSEYVRVMNQFYRETSQAIIDTDGFMLEIVGDQIFALYPTGFSGVHADDASADESALVRARQIRAAQKAIRAATTLSPSGRHRPAAAPYGLAVHSADVYIGTIRGAEEGIVDVRVWGKEVNKAARMSAAAQAGEVLISDEACMLAGIDTNSMEHRDMQLKGLSGTAGVRVLQL